MMDVGFQYRGKARVVAIMDLILTSISIWKPVGLLVTALVGTFYEGEIEVSIREELKENGIIISDNEIKNRVTTFVISFWISFIFFLCVFLLEIVAAVKLLNATQTGLDAKMIRSLARFWRIVTGVLTIFTICGLFVEADTLEMVFYIPFVIFHGIGIYIVGGFILEVESAVMRSLPSYQGQGVGVSIMFGVANDGQLMKAYEQLGKK